ncbi:hypothetical protein C5F48_22650 [Cereibacter changlensis JA139]|uniref:Uncharacterized protein n=1 Tax=Cereibacter changlensis JA139 TaxID=1188249 RepID=A0A2T4JNK2_9RHOB|nr:hypothetical protein [Cereibacter changlensis]PTE19492.1 hypothetical protein C5F48_22650 [Cereibacter changlensis JA139]
MRIILVITASVLVVITAGVVGLLHGGWSGMSTSAFVTFALIYVLGISLLLARAGDGTDDD